MPQAKKNKERKQNLINFKEKQKQKNMSETQQLPQPSPVRQVPVWSSNETLEIKGIEFEAIYNYINSVQGAYAAMQSVMNRNILSGKVQIDFEKLNDTQTAYVPMSAEEKAPHLAEVQATLDALRKQSQTQTDTVSTDAPKVAVEDVSPESEATEAPKPSMVIVP